MSTFTPKEYKTNNLSEISVKTKVDFYNVECTVTDPSYVYFDACKIKAVNRTYKYFAMIAKFPRRQPVHNISMTFALLRRANGYKPFLYNFTVDCCKYMKKRNNPVINYFHSWFEKYSTINRTCPYGPQDEVVDKLPVSHINRMTTEILPVPQGQYVFHTSWLFYNTKVAIVKLFFQIM
ncbi:uncharacterized protein LOC120776945 [Bactrocera tryoni]|uniref:uncharacterized protein LOC120776945 n=1 Tax=Bactrocera tryoni TaxID=59916 RepID=UPI001A982D21|nr:uncharacterized protein LOC120776945 [Bactrocera tryoni]